MPTLVSRHFILGMACGLSLAFVLVSFNSGARQPPPSYRSSLRGAPDQLLGQGQGVGAPAPHVHDHRDDSPEDLADHHVELDAREKAEAEFRKIDFDEDKEMHHDDDTEAERIRSKVRVLVWIMTGPQNLATKAKAVRDTWSKRADKVIFFSSEQNDEFPTIGLPTQEGREHLTAKTMMGFRYVWEHHQNDAEWFMKADDDSYVIMENLRYFLSDQNSSDPIWFGHLFQTIVKQGYYSGGGGYVLSKESLRRMYEKGGDPAYCRQDGGSEDAELGKCMMNLGVLTANTTDALGRSRFHCFDTQTHLLGGFADWYRQYDAMGGIHGQETISDYAISFHYVKPAAMVEMEFYIYHLRPYGILSGLQKLNAKNPNRLLLTDVRPLPK